MRVTRILAALVITSVLILSACSPRPVPPSTTAPVKPQPTTKPAPTLPATTSSPPTRSPETPPAAVIAAVKDLRKGWQQQMVYQNMLINPSQMATKSDGTIMVVSRGNNRILSLSGNGDLAEFADTASLPGVFAIGYQPGMDRLLAVDQMGSLYQYADGQWKRLKLFSLQITTMTVDSRDDSFYGGSQVSDGTITHYDAEGKQMSVIATKVNGCFQMLLDEGTNTLYYTETFAGRISAVNLADNSQRVIATGVGIPGTYEPIALGFDGDNRLYYFTANQGLNLYENGGFRKVMNSISGVGMMVWSPEQRAFLVGNAAGSNIIAYDPVTVAARNLTPYVNAWGIVETNDGTVLIAEDDIFRVDENGLSPFVVDLPAPCYHLERDDDGLIYAGLIDGSIWLVAADGTRQPWSGGFTETPVVSLSYDSKNRAMVSVNANHQLSQASIWRIPLDAPSNAVKVLDLSDVRVTPHLPLATVDDAGNIYVIDRRSNTIYRIADGTSTANVFISGVLENEAITVPGIEYSRIENALVISTIENYELWSLDNPVRRTLAVNAGGVDNFGINEGPDGALVMIQSGRVFKLVPSPQ